MKNDNAILWFHIIMIVGVVAFNETICHNSINPVVWAHAHK